MSRQVIVVPVPSRVYPSLQVIVPVAPTVVTVYSMLPLAGARSSGDGHSVKKVM